MCHYCVKIINIKLYIEFYYKDTCAISRQFLYGCCKPYAENEEANKLKDQVYEFKRQGNAIGMKMYANQAITYNLKIMKLSRYGMCLDDKLKEELKFKEGKRQCVSETGIDPRK